MLWLQVRHLKDLLEPCKRTVLESFGSHSAPVDIGLATGVIVCTIEKANTLVRGRPGAAQRYYVWYSCHPQPTGMAPHAGIQLGTSFTHTLDGLKAAHEYKAWRKNDP